MGFNGISGDLLGYMMVYPLVICDIAIENGPVEIVDLPINSMVIFHSYVNVYQRAGFPKPLSNSHQDQQTWSG